MKYFVAFALSCTAIAGILAYVFAGLDVYFGEEGAIEMLSAIGLLVAAVIVLWHAPLPPALCPALIFVLLAEREFDVAVLAPGNPLRVAVTWIEDRVLHSTVGLWVLGLGLLVTFLAFTLPWLLRRQWRGKVDIRILLIGLAFGVGGQAAEFIVTDVLTAPSAAFLKAMMAMEEI